MSSPYVVLGDRPLDQWKVTELKEELKKRRLTIGGLKVDLIKRLDEAVRHEQEENEKVNVDNGLLSGIQSELPSEQQITEAVVLGSTGDHIDIGVDSTQKVDSGPANEIDDGRLLDKDKVVEGDTVKETSTAGLEQSAQYACSETTVVFTESVESVTTVTETFLPSDRENEMTDLTVGLENDVLKPRDDARPRPSNATNEFPHINQNSMSVLSPTCPCLLDGETQNDAANPTVQLQNNESSSLQSNQSFLLPSNQVSMVDHPDLESQVASDSISTESMSLIEKNELKVDVITDNVKLELDVKHEMVQPSLNSVAPDGGESHPMDVEESLEDNDVKEPPDMKVSVGKTGGNNSQNDDSLKDTDAGDLDPPEKLSLDRSPGDYFMEDDIFDSKQKEYKFCDSETIDCVEKSEIFVQKENFVDVVGNGKPLEAEVVEAEQKTVPALSSSKRKFDKEAVVHNDTAKRARRWITEVGPKSSEPQSGTTVASAAPDDSAQPTFKRFSRSNSLVNEEPPKERVVPPSSKPPTNSLRIDQFLRPFTLKAVQELLGKTGRVNSFWMDQIKTHCYVSYSSVEEAVNTRNTVYNLQWPPNGGRLLVAEFADPEEVKKYTEGPPALATPPSNATPAFSPKQHGTAPPQLPPRAQVLRQLPPPPPTSKPLSREPIATSAKDRINLPPPPPLSTKVEPPIVSLDDLFKKTKAIPRIYYLPLSDEQVAAKKLTKGNVNQ